jgi:hypothetical protein
MSRLCFSFLWIFFSALAFSKDTIQTGTSVSHFYDARSVFTNPAALSYQKELNGTELLSAFTFGWREGRDDLALALSYGGWGFGVERFLFNQELVNRYSLASSIGLGPWVFLGSRLGFLSASPSQEGMTQFDLGLQIRPSRYFSLGGLVNRSNQYSVGITLRPLERLLLQADWENENQFQGSIQFELFKGFLLLEVPIWYTNFGCNEFLLVFSHVQYGFFVFYKVAVVQVISLAGHCLNDGASAQGRAARAGAQGWGQHGRAAGAPLRCARGAGRCPRGRDDVEEPLAARPRAHLRRRCARVAPNASASVLKTVVVN